MPVIYLACSLFLFICGLEMRILAVAFLALIGAFLAAGTASAASDTASGIQNSTTPASGSNATSGVQNSTTPQLQFFPPAAYGSPCSKSAPVVAWNGAGSGKGTYCITLPICTTGQFLTTIADGNGNPSFICVDPSAGSTAAATPTDDSSNSGSSSSTSSSSTSSSCDEAVLNACVTACEESASYTAGVACNALGAGSAAFASCVSNAYTVEGTCQAACCSSP
jgi:hypothetical protein